MASSAGIDLAIIDDWMKKYEKNEKLLVAQKGCTHFNTLSFLSNQQCNLNHVFNKKVSVEVKPVTNQKSSGRCWIYACLNVLRIAFCKQNSVEEFELSQTYIFFWDKVERCNYMLKSFVKLAQEGADHDDRTLAHLLSNPTNDGGQWQMLVNLIEKYGLISLSQWPSPVLAENSSRLNTVLNNQLRTNCSILLRMVKEGKTAKELEDAVCTMMSSIFEVISTCLGSPPQVVDFEYYDKDKNYHKVGPITPLQFYQTMFKPLFDLEKQVVLTHDPRSTSPYYKTYTVAYLNNMGSCKPVTYLNLPIEQLKKYTKDSIEADKAVWFGCDVGKEFSSEDATLVTDQFNYKLVLGIDIRGADKATRLLYKDSEMTHAMVFTGINVEENGEVSKYRVENSWGENGGSKGKGYLMMNDAWFDEYVYLVVIDQSLLSEDIIECLKQEPVVLPAWDPMGALAIN